jgi:hypothetical protein
MTKLLQKIDEIIARERKAFDAALEHRHDRDAMNLASGGGAVAREIKRLVEAQE